LGVDGGLCAAVADPAFFFAFGDVDAGLAAPPDVAALPRSSLELECFCSFLGADLSDEADDEMLAAGGDGCPLILTGESSSSIRMIS
jgi:hypothetical protein